MLPWLPAFDRRDALVVQSVLDTLLSESGAAGSGPRLNPTASEQLVHETDACALAASCYAAALLQPSSGDPIGTLDACAWLQQKAIALPMGRPVRLAALRMYGWRVHRGCPDVLGTPTGRLRVVSPPTSSCRWDASDMRPVATVPPRWLVLSFLVTFVAADILYVATFGLLAIDMSAASTGDGRRALDYTFSAAYVAPVHFLGAYGLLAGVYVAPWFLNHPHPVHCVSFGTALGAVGYDVLKEIGVNLLIGYIGITVPTLILFLYDSSVLATVPRMATDPYTAEMVNATHPGVDAAPFTYIVWMLAIHFEALFFAIPAAHATWHMWCCVRRSGVTEGLRSADSWETTLVSFARPAGAEESIEVI